MNKPPYRVWDPIGKTWSVGWIALYKGDQFDRWVPVWQDYIFKEGGLNYESDSTRI